MEFHSSSLCNRVTSIGCRISQRRERRIWSEYLLFLARPCGFDLEEIFFEGTNPGLFGELAVRFAERACSADLAYSHPQISVHNQGRLCFCAVARERKMARSIVTGVWSRTSAAPTTGLFNDMFFIWARLTTSSRRPGRRPWRFLRMARPSRARSPYLPKIGPLLSKTSTSVGSNFQKCNCAVHGTGVPAGWPAISIKS